MATSASNPRPTQPNAGPDSIRDPHTRSDQLKRDAMNTGILRHPAIQRLLTWQTGLPHTNQDLPLHHPLESLGPTSVAILFGFSCCYQALQGEWAWWFRCLLLVIGWSHILLSLRYFRLPLRHAAAHGFLSGNAQVDYWIGQTICALLLAAPMSGYSRSHVSVHHQWKRLMKPAEPTWEEIKSLGFHSGVPNETNWGHLRSLLLSPRYYYSAFASGAQDAFCKGTIGERLFNSTFWCVILMAALLTHVLGVFLVAYVIPRLAYDAVQCLRVLIEHTFDEQGQPRTLVSYKHLTSAIILAEPLPELSNEANQIEYRIRLFKWCFAMLTHYMVRCYIATGDTCNHPSHHLRPGASFINHPTERMKLVNEGHAIHSNWGLVAAIDAFFTSLSKQPADLFTRNQE
jgi:hypothetical protein